MSLKKFTSSMVFILFIVFGMNAQQVLVRGVVTDEFDEGMMTSVFVKGTTIGTSSDIDGNYSLSLSVGAYVIVYRAIGYKNYEFNVTLSAGQDLVKNYKMEEETVDMDEIVVIAPQASDRISTVATITTTQNNNQISTTVGTQQLEQQSISTAGDAITKKVAGVANTSNEIFVRGLGDRYNVAMLNGLPLPSPNPDLRVIPLDLFPTSIVKSIGVSKTFSSELYGDFAGATVNIATKFFPAVDFLQIGLSSGFNSVTTGKEFISSEGGKTDFFGFDDGTRTIPDVIENMFIFKPKGDDIKNVFSTGFNPMIKKASMPIGFSVTGGKRIKLRENSEKSVGVLFSSNFSNKYEIRKGAFKELNAQGRILKNYEQDDRYSYSTNFSNLLTLHTDLNDRNSISYDVLFLNTSSNVTSETQGYDSDRDATIFRRRNTFTQNTLLTNQLIGSHQLTTDIDLNWAFSYSSAKNNQPDRRQNTFVLKGNGTYELERLDLSNNHRFFIHLIDNEKAGRGCLSKKYGEKLGDEKRGKISVGYQLRAKNRSFRSREIDYAIDESFNSTFNNNIDVLNPDFYFTKENLANGLIILKDPKYISRNYFVNLTIHSGYLENIYDIVPEKVKMIVGARVEYSDQLLKYKEQGDLLSGNYSRKRSDNLAILPSVATRIVTKKGANDKPAQLLRIAASKTISRPGFTELGKFNFRDQYGRDIEGNENLKIADNYNLDLKYEFYPKTGTMIAIGAFGKYLDHPIERVNIAGSGTLFSFENVTDAKIAGTELEMNYQFGEYGSNESFKDRTSFSFNAAYLYSRSRIAADFQSSKSTIVFTNKVRPLQGAAPVLLNAAVNHKLMLGEFESNVNLSYGLTGKKLFAAGTDNAGDIFEMPIHTINLSLRNQLSENLKLNLSFKNLLNYKIQQVQEFDQKIVINDFRRGIDVSFSLSYAFNKKK